MPGVFAAIGSLLASVGGGSALAGAATLGSLASTGVGLGETIAHSGGGSQPLSIPSTPTTPTAPTPTPGPTPAQLAQGSQAASNTQAQTGGSLSPDYIVSLLSSLGLPGQQSANNLFGLSSSPPAGAPPVGSSIVDGGIKDLYSGFATG